MMQLLFTAYLLLTYTLRYQHDTQHYHDLSPVLYLSASDDEVGVMFWQGNEGY